MFCMRFINRTHDSLDTFAESCFLENNVEYITHFEKLNLDNFTKVKNITCVKN